MSEQTILQGDCLEELRDELARFYIVTPDGRVISRYRGMDLSFPLDFKGYPKTRLMCPAFSKNRDRRKPFRLHKVIAIFHLKGYDPKLTVNHKNGIKTDNRVENLEMMTNKQNVWHAWNVLDSAARRKKVSSWTKGRKLSQKTKDIIGRKARLRRRLAQEQLF